MVQIQFVVMGVTLALAVGAAIYNHFSNSRHDHQRNPYSAYDDSYPDYPSAPGNYQSPPTCPDSDAAQRRKKKPSTCTICLTVNWQTSDLRELSCGHCFHRKCIDTWLRSAKKCPNCRAPVYA